MTINTWIGCAPFFSTFAIRMEMLAMNPCDALEREKRFEPSTFCLGSKLG
jgi:hypothetical protein